MFNRCLITLFILFIFLSTVQASEQVIYQDLPSDVFLKNWLVCGPVKVLPYDSTNIAETLQVKAFNQPEPSPAEIEKSLTTGQIQLEGNSFSWKVVKSGNDIIDLRKEVSPMNYAYALALAQIDCKEDRSMLWGLGSDDAIKIWVNGELVHNNWIGRATQIDNDLIEMKLKKGLNTILMKIQNMQGDWSFAFRPLGAKTLPDQLLTFISRGSLDDVELILANGVDVNHKFGPGFTPKHAAEVFGRQEIVELLLKKGADPKITMPPAEKLVDYLFTKAVKADYPGASVMVARDGKILYQNGFGWANIQKKEKITPETTFRIGSITKQFTAAAILKLQEQGKLSVEDKLSKYIPDFPRGEQVTIHQLLTHTSGIHSFTSVPDFMEQATRPIQEDEMIQKIKSYDYDFNPGDAWMYNNSGFFILSYIVEKVSGQSFDAFLKNNFFESMKMQNTGVYSKTVPFKHEAIGYNFENDSVKIALDWDMSQAGGAGNLYSTVKDLFLWNEAIFNKKALQENSLQAAFTPVKLNNGEQASAFGAAYGYGWGISKYRGLTEISHSGGLNGFNCYLCRFPEKNFTVAVLSNALSNIPGLSPGSIAHQAAEIYLWKELEKQVTVSVKKDFNPEVLNDYLGRYDYQMAGVLEVTCEGEHLFAQMTNQPKFEIFPNAQDEFFWKVVDARIKFNRDVNGQVIGATHYQGGNSLIVTKMAEVKEFQIDPAVLPNYAGEYTLMPGFVLTVTAEGNQLFVQATAQPKIEVYPKSETVFFYKVVAAEIAFVKDESGKVTHLFLKQGGMDRKADKTK